MKNQVVLRRIKAEWTPMEGMSRRERRIVAALGGFSLLLLLIIIVWAVMAR